MRRSAVVGGVWPFVQLVCGRRCSGPVSCGLARPYRWRVDGIGRLHHISGICRYGRDGIEIDNRLVQQWKWHGRLRVFGPSGRLPLQRWLLQQCRVQRLLVEFFAQWRQCLAPALERQRSSHQPEQLRIREAASRSGVSGMPIERSEGGLTL